MSVRTPQRAAAAAPIVAAALLLGACGSSGSASSTESTINLGDDTTTDYVTLPPATTPTTVPEQENAVGVQQEYTVQPGDYGILVAQKFGVSLEDLSSVNGWANPSVEFPGPGEVILIPATATSTGTSTTDGESESGDTAGEGETGTPITDPGENCGPGSYTIEAGDVPLRVANKFDVTLEELNEANVGTEGYSSFFVGLEIVIPGAEDC